MSLALTKSKPGVPITILSVARPIRPKPFMAILAMRCPPRLPKQTCATRLMTQSSQWRPVSCNLRIVGLIGGCTIHPPPADARAPEPL